MILPIVLASIKYNPKTIVVVYGHIAVERLL